MDYQLRDGSRIDVKQLSENHQDLIYQMHEHYEKISTYEAEDKWGHFEWVTSTTIDESIRNNHEHPVERIRGDLLRNLMIQCGMFGEPSAMFIKAKQPQYSSKRVKTS